MRKTFASLCLILILVFLGDLRAVAQPLQTPADAGKATITGSFFLKGGTPMAGGSVFFYDAQIGAAPFRDQLKRLPSFIAQIDEKGAFKAEVTSGRYYLRAHKRTAGRRSGPLQDGDHVYFGLDDRGEAKEYVLNKGDLLDIGTVSGIVPLKEKVQKVRTAISGTIRDSRGNPVEGVAVFASLDGSLRSQPVYFSSRTGPDGSYVLGVSAGTYYLRARNTLKGGPPAPGTYLGNYGGEHGVPVSVKDGEIVKTIDIMVLKFVGKGPDLKAGQAPGPGPRPGFE